MTVRRNIGKEKQTLNKTSEKNTIEQLLRNYHSLRTALFVEFTNVIITT